LLKGGSTMKGNIKRLALFVIITVIAPFIMAVMASAGPLFPPALQGQYTVTGAGTTLFAPLSFTTKLIPKDAAQGNWLIQTFNSGGVYTFNLDGTGRAELQLRAIAFPFTGANPNPPPPRVPFPPSAGASSIVFSFHYTITDDGKITITADPGNYVVTMTNGPSTHWDGLKISGSISYDGKMIVANGGAPDIMSIVPPVGPFPPTLQAISNTSVVMTWRSW
jgi:hypothetical protein